MSLDDKQTVCAKNRSEQLIDLLSKEAASGKAFDIAEPCAFFAFDVMGDLGFGEGERDQTSHISFE